MTPFRLGPGDVMAGENPAKVAAALQRFRPRVVETAEDFDRGYRLLDAQFGALNELERREVLERWFAGEHGAGGPIEARYHMLLIEDADGRIAAVRDCFTALDREVPRVVTLMSHSLVLPEWRRSGVAAIVRASPVFFARLHAEREAPGRSAPEILLVSEMEHVDPSDRDTLVRLFAYVRAGFRIVPPWIVPYAQPDFRDLAALGEEARPLPFTLLVRHVGHESATEMSWERVQALFDGLQAIHGPSCGMDQLLAIREVALVNRDTSPGATVPLYVPDVDRPDDIAPLLRSALAAHYPSAWHGDRPLGDPEDDRRALIRLAQESK